MLSRAYALCGLDDKKWRTACQRDVSLYAAFLFSNEHNLSTISNRFFLGQASNVVALLLGEKHETTSNDDQQER